MNAEVVSIGTELLLGEIVDTNSAHIARSLRDIGLNLFYLTTVGDNQMRIAEVLDAALNRSDVIITTGGLGPTVDDMTRQAVAAVTNRPLVFSQELFDQIVERFRRLGSTMSPNNRQQAFIPEGAIPIENPVGTAPCFIVETERGVVISLPGVPREMKYLLDTVVLPYLRAHFELSSIIKARVLRTAGIGESQVDQAIIDLMTLANPTVGLAAHIGQTDIRITAKAEDEATADRMIAEIEERIRERVGDFIYGTDKDQIEHALVAELERNSTRLAASEIGLEDRLAARLTAVPGSEHVLAGTENHASLEELCRETGSDAGLPLEELAVIAAQNLRERLQAGIGIALVGRDDGTAVAVAAPGHAESRLYRADPQEAHPVVWASTWGMALAWRWLTKQG